jgi:hypothetical protein
VRCRFRGASESARAVRSYFALAARSSSSRTAQKMYAGLRRPISSPIASSTLWDNPGGDTPRRRLPGHPGGESGTTTEGRGALRTVLEFLHASDILMVTRIECLARRIGDLRTSFALSGGAGRS